MCRPAADFQCDLPEFCSGSSASCPPDLYVQDGHDCGRGTGYCYEGLCQSLDLQCKRLYGRGNRLVALAGGTGTAQGQGWPQHHEAQFVPVLFNAPISGESGAPGGKAQF